MSKNASFPQLNNSGSPKRPPRRVKFRRRRIFGLLILLAGLTAWLIANPKSWQTEIIYGSNDSSENTKEDSSRDSTTNSASQISGETDADGNYYASALLAKLETHDLETDEKYNRSEQFYSSWPSIDGCSLRQRIIKRDFTTTTLDSDNCTVIAGTYTEPYTGKELTFSVKTEISKGIQIDHIVALSNAWQTGAQNLSSDERYALATDSLNLVAADADANQEKLDADASEWLPPNRAFRCEYVARQISVKYKYRLWVTESERAAMQEVLSDCPAQTAITE